MLDHVSGASSTIATATDETDTPVTVRVTRCCGVLLGDECGCAAFAAEARGVFSRNVIMCRPASRWGA